MIINNPFAPGIQVAVTGETLRWKVLSIGVWDMVADFQIDVAHGLAKENILNVFALIYNDAMTSVKPINFSAHVTDNSGTFFIGATTVRLIRITGGEFDNIDHNDAVMNRGYIYMVYKD